MTAMEQEAPKKKASKTAKKSSPEMTALIDHSISTATEALGGNGVGSKGTGTVLDGEINVVELPKSKVKPGHKDFDWKSEYPGEDDVYVFTSSDGLTIGLTKLGPKRKPKPGLLRRLHREGGMSVMWYFVELASSDTSLKLQEELEEEDYTNMLRGWAEFAGIELSE